MLGGLLALEGIALMVFSQMDTLLTAIVWMIVFGLAVQATSGATFAVVPFINKNALGSVSAQLQAICRLAPFPYHSE